MGAGAMYALQGFLRFFRAEARRVGDHHLGEPDDGVERRAQLVAHVETNCDLCFARQLSWRLFSCISSTTAQSLDRDHRLVGEGGEQLDLFVRKRPRLEARQAPAPRSATPHA